MDRYIRIQMILPKSRASVILTSAQVIILLLVLIVVTATIKYSCELSQNCLITEFHQTLVKFYDNAIPFVGLLLILTNLLIEMVCNIRLVLTSLNSLLMNKKTAEQEKAYGHVATTNLKDVEYMNLRFKMVLLYSLIASIDLISIGLSVVGGFQLPQIPLLETLLIASSMFSFHYYFAFWLLVKRT